MFPTGPIALSRGARLARAAVLLLVAACPGALAADAPSGGPPAPAGAARSDAEAVLAVLDAEALFGRGGSALAAEARVVVDRLADRLDALERVLSVRVIGHADNVGDAADNLALSTRRAESIAAAFRARWPGVHTLALGAGETEPVADNATEAGRARNRRAEIQVIGIGRPEALEAFALDAAAPIDVRLSPGGASDSPPAPPTAD